MNAKKSQGNAKADSFALDSKLRLYAIAAGAAGVSVLALGRSAAAEIIYTPAHRALPLSGDFQFLDINGDGVPDLAFLHYTYGLSNSFNNVIRVDARNNGVEGIDIRYAEPLSAGATIGQSANFKGGIRSRSRICAQALHGGPVEQRSGSLPRRFIQDRNRNPLWMGSDERQRSKGSAEGSHQRLRL